jgi:exodeoxyribonuclease VII large subunit
LAASLAGRRSAADRLADRLSPLVPARIERERERVSRSGERLRPLVPARLARERDRLERAQGRLPVLAGARVAGARASLDAASAALAVLAPQATLDRGYAIVRRADDGAIVRDPREAPAGTSLRLRVARGEIAAVSQRTPTVDVEGGGGVGAARDAAVADAGSRVGAGVARTSGPNKGVGAGRDGGRGKGVSDGGAGERRPGEDARRDEGTGTGPDGAPAGHSVAPGEP